MPSALSHFLKGRRHDQRCENAAQLEQASKRLCKMQRKRMMLNVISYSATISACENERGVNKCVSSCVWQDHRIELNVVSYNATIKACENRRSPGRRVIRRARCSNIV